MAENILYSQNKIVHHPEAIQLLRTRMPSPPIHIHFMPMLDCNHSCRFCAYGHRTQDDGPDQHGWKNMALMSSAFMPEEKMNECLRDWVALGVKAVEITGGGEPLMYPYIDSFLGLVRESPLEWALVTNGTGLTERRAKLLEGFTWARVSIDAGTQQTYVSTHRADSRHWKLAWSAVERLLRHRVHSEAKVGVSYVVDYTNWNELYLSAQESKKAGADNIRFTLAFTPQVLQRFPPGALDEAILQVQAAQQELSDQGFQVINLIADRCNTLLSPRQDYGFCGMKELTCVVAGDLNVYTCCSLAFNQKGLIGSIKNISFHQLWTSSTKNTFFLQHNPRVACRNPCLFEQRNRAILELISAKDKGNLTLDVQPPQLHTNFL